MGADYRKAHRTPLLLNTQNQLLANQTWYFTHANLIVENQASFLCPINGHLRELYAYQTVAPGVGETTTYTVMVNGIATALTCQIAGALQAANDLVNVVVVNVGDRISIRVANSLNAANTYPKAGMILVHA